MKRNARDLGEEITPLLLLTTGFEAAVRASAVVPVIIFSRVRKSAESCDWMKFSREEEDSVASGVEPGGRATTRGL